MKICHVISDLDAGGAERMLVNLLGAMDRGRFEQRIVCMLGPGPLSGEAEALGAAVDHLGLTRGAVSPGAFFRVAGILKSFQPDVVQTWLYHADLLGLMAARLARTGKVVWNIRCSDMDLSRYRVLTRLVLRLNARLSNRPAAVISNSRRALDLHIGMGFRPRRTEVIPNGFDLSRFRPDPEAGARVRAELSIPESAPVVGMVARFDPQKGHDTFFAAAGLLSGRFKDAHFILAGLGVEPGNPEIASLAGAAGLGSRVHLLGRREDTPALMNSLAVLACPSSYGEGFPSVAGEAMACGKPCVVTDVGDSAYVVGDTGKVAPPKDPPALAEALGEVLSMPPGVLAGLGRAARERVEKNFSLPAVAARYEALYESLL